MGKLKVIKSSPLATVQDKGRYGHRQYGIPQSGAMDLHRMMIANQRVGNPVDHPVIEYALMGVTLEALEPATIAVAGAQLMVNGKLAEQQLADLSVGDVAEVSRPKYVYAYLSVLGRLEIPNFLGSYSTYLMGELGGLDGRSLRRNDVLSTENAKKGQSEILPEGVLDGVIRFMKGPEFGDLQEELSWKRFTVLPTSNRMGIRLEGAKLQAKAKEIPTSAVIPGIIQLPPSGQPIVLMNDCQTTGGYPRIGKVLNEDLGKLAQIRPGDALTLIETSLH